MNKIYRTWLLMAAVFFLNSCDDPNMEEERVMRMVKIAVVLPGEYHDRWERIMNMAEKNISEATDIQPVFEFYDENSLDIMRLAYTLANEA